MRKAFVEPVALPEPRFRDGLGVRYLRTAGTDDPVEVMRPLWDVGAMQNAIRQRVSRLQSFRQARFITLRGAEVPRDDPSTVEVISDFVAGYRLSQYLDAARAGAITIETNVTVYILRELLGALALLRESRGVTHGAVGPERILITPKGRLVVADYVLGPAIERLEFTRPRLWREFRVPVPAGKGHPKLDDKADVMQVGLTAIALLVGRSIDVAEFPDRLDDLIVTIGHARKSSAPVPPTLVGWVRRAVFKDPGGKFGDVSDARLLLESVVSNHDIASGGAAALKTLAEGFGRYAADLEAKAAAVAAEEARKAALAAQAAAMEAIRLAAAETVVPGSSAVPAFALLADAPEALAAGSTSEVVGETSPLPAAEADPPVGWRVPEQPPVEETLPVSPLIQIDAPLDAAASEEFIEEVLDLTELAGVDEPETVMGEPVHAETTDTAAPEAAACETPEAADAPGAVMCPPPGDLVVDAAVAALEAEADAQAPAPASTLPEWRLLADPDGAAAPTIDVVEPAETLDELVAEFAAEFAATPGVETTEPAPPFDGPLAEAAPAPAHSVEAGESTAAPAPAVVVADAAPEIVELPAATLMEPPAAMLQVEASPVEVPTEFAAPAAWVETRAEEPRAAEPRPAETDRTAFGALELDVVVDLQEAQAEAQAALERPSEPGPAPADVAAWSFVEELLHRDARFEPHEDEPAALPVEAAAHAAGEPAESPLPALAAGPAVEMTVEPVLRDEPVVDLTPEPMPPVEGAVEPLPADWFIEVGRRGRHAEAADTSRQVTTPEVAPAPVVEEAVAPLPPASTSIGSQTTTESAAGTAPLSWRQRAVEREEDPGGPVFPRVAPSVQRVRAEARRRRWARIGTAITGGLAAVGAAFGSGASALAGGVAAAGRGVAGAIVALLRAMAGGAAAVGAGAVAAASAAFHGVGAVVRGAATGLSAAAAGTASVVSAALKGASAGVAWAARGAMSAIGLIGRASLRATASAVGGTAAAGRFVMSGAGRAAGALTTGMAVVARGIGRTALVAMRGCGAAAVAVSRALGAGARALGRAVLGTARAAGRATTATAGTVGRAASTAGSAAGKGASVAGTGIARAAVTVPRRVYFLLSDAADHLPRPLFRPWYLAAALVVIVAVAGVPYAKTWLSQHGPELRSTFTEATKQPAPAALPSAPAATAGGGSIRVTVDPAGADVLLDGMLQGSSPLTIENLKEGPHTVLVRNESGTVRQTVRVRTGQMADVSLKIRPGWLAVFAPVKLEVLERGGAIGSTEGGRILAAPGPHTIELVSQAIGFRETRQVDIKPGEVTAVTIQLPPATVEVVAPAGSEILVDGESAGQAPLGPLQVAVGTREFVMRHPALGERRQVVTVTYNGPARISFE